MTNDWLSIGTAAVILLSPGPTNTLLLASATRIGIFRSMPLLSAELGGYLIAILTIEAVLGDALRASALAMTVLRVISAAYLLFLAVRTWTARAAGTAALVSWPQVFVTTVFNPKALLFAAILLPLPAPQQARFLWEFAALVPLVGALWICAGHGLVRIGGLRVSTFAPKFTSCVLATFSVLLMVRVLST